MDLLSKTLVVAVVLVIIIAVAYFAFEKVFVPGPVTEQQAATIITQYLQSSNPNAQVNITNESQSSQYPGSWHVVVSVISNPTTTCPTYIVYYFDYPKFSLVNNTFNPYTQDCKIVGYVKGSSYIIGSFPVAIVYSYDLNNSAISNFVNINGNRSVVVHALYYPNISINGFNYTKVWIVNYSSITTNKSIYAIVSQVNGTFYSTYNASR